MKKPYWVFPKGAEWVMIAFAESNHEAKKIGFNHSPVSDDNAPYLEWRAKRADGKWMELAHPDVECLESCPLEYETWNEWFESEFKKKGIPHV